jgi:hypothetical protein
VEKDRLSPPERRDRTVRTFKRYYAARQRVKA